jgi:HEPN domain-containing protein
VKADFLKKRAKSFLENAETLIKKEEYSLAAFNLEQASQLYLKYHLFLKLKDFPKTHSLSELLVDIGDAYGKQKEIERLRKEYASVIGDLEQAYISSRYLPVEFYLPQVEEMRKFVEKLLKFLESL